VYALILERLERHVLNERQVAVIAKLGGEKGSLPTFDGERAKLDRLLVEEPRKRYGPEQAALIAALGLGRG
jgi:hypothetical protein